MIKRDEALQAIADKHKIKDVYRISVPMNDEGTDIEEAFFKKPNRKVLGAAMSSFQRDPIKAMEVLLNSTFIEGDKRVLEDDEAFIAAAQAAQQMINVRAATIKKN